MNVLQLICSDNFIAVNKSLIAVLGIEPALLLGELASEAVYWNMQDTYFFSTVENIEEKTTLSAYQQRKALALLQEKGVIDVISKKGSPPKRFIKINEDALLKLFDVQNSKNLTSKSEEISLSKVKKLNTNNKEVNKKRVVEKDYIKTAIEKTNFTSEEFKTALEDFVDMRKKVKKPATDRAIAMLVKKACELGNNDEGTVIEIFNQSTLNSWLGVYPLKNNYSYSSGRRSRNAFMDMLNDMEDEENDKEGSGTNLGFAQFGIPEHTD